MKEKIITGAWAHREAVFHASISEMIKTYSVVSTEIDGLVPLHNHFFSHLTLQNRMLDYYQSPLLKLDFCLLIQFNIIYCEL